MFGLHIRLPIRLCLFLAFHENNLFGLIVVNYSRMMSIGLQGIELEVFPLQTWVGDCHPMYGESVCRVELLVQGRNRFASQLATQSWKSADRGRLSQPRG